MIETTTTRRPAPVPAATPHFNSRERFLRVFSFFLGVVVHIYFWDVFLHRFGLLRWYVRRSMMQRWVRIARRFRVMALEMGGMQIKLGQFLSSRADIVPDAVRRELAGLQDEVPPAPASHVLGMIIDELGAPPGEVFQQFESQAVAAASLGQVHFATLHDGREVAVKIQRPFIEQVIEVDLRALAWIVRLIRNYPPIRRRADLDALLSEFSRVLRQELDYVQEARNAELFRTNFAGVPGIHVPQPISELTRRRVLVMERISGIKINDLATLTAKGVSRRELADRLNNTYLKQFFVDGFFHADPHPGNLFVRIEPSFPLDSYTNGHTPFETLFSDVEGQPALPPTTALDSSGNGATPATGTPFTLIFVDFGMVGHLPPHTREIVRGGVLGLATNNAERIVDALDKLKMILPGADRRPIVKAIQILLRHSFNRSMREMTNMDVEAIFDETQDIIFDLPFQIPQDLLYLGRAMSMVGGLATEIEPDINLFESLHPFARHMLERERQEVDWLARVQQELRELGQILINLPREMDAYYRAVNNGEMQNQTDMQRLERSMRRVERSNERLAGGVVAASFFLGGVQLRNRGMTKEAERAWWAAAVATIWSLWPRGDR